MVSTLCRTTLKNVESVCLQSGMNAITNFISRQEKVQAVAKYILSKNIICGNALSMMEVDGNGKDIEGHYVIFSEWSFVMGNSVKRRDFRLDQLLDGSNGVNRNFGTDFEYDKETNTFIPLPIKEYPITDYLNLPNVEDYVPEEEEEPEQLSFFKEELWQTYLPIYTHLTY